MPGQTIVTIGDKQWQCTVASTPQELVTGLSGVESIAPGTGMLFDMGWDYPVIDIYTDEMLFPLDIIFINSAYGVVEVLRNIRPGDEAIFQGEQGAVYFLEVNAGEAEGIEVGDGVLFQFGEEVPVVPNWVTGLVGIIGFVAMGFFMVTISRDLVKKAFGEPVASERGVLAESPAVIPEHRRQRRLKNELEFLPDSPEFLAYTIDDIGYRGKIDSAFLNAIARARGDY